MNRDKLLDECRAGNRCFWVCFDLGNPAYLWWYPTREEARERYNKHKANPDLAQLSSPVKCKVRRRR
ncbi:MAG: hypothetical protein ACTSW7_00820 [Candidatus Thorarchaeota archaeon]|nr:hypothetical protein [Thermoplasmatales archaeon]